MFGMKRATVMAVTGSTAPPFVSFLLGPSPVLEVLILPVNVECGKGDGVCVAAEESVHSDRSSG